MTYLPSIASIPFIALVKKVDPHLALIETRARNSTYEMMLNYHECNIERASWPSWND